MLQRPQNILKAYDRSSHQRLPVTSTWTLYSRGLDAEVQLSDTSQAGSFTSTRNWDVARAVLVDKWARVVFQRRVHLCLRRPLVGRNMVKGVELGKSLGLQSQLSASTPNCSFVVLVEKIQVALPPAIPRNTWLRNIDQRRCQGEKPWVKEFDANQRNSNSEYGEEKQKDHLSRYPAIGPVDPMESNKQLNASSRSSHCHRTPRGGDSRLQTPEQYITLKKKEAVARLMAAFNKWLDEKIVAIENAYEASDASGESSMNTSKSNPPDNSKSSKSSRGAKRQFDGDDQDNFSAGGDENGQDRGGNKRARKEPEHGRKWACPFFKHDPNTYGQERCCAGPGWPTIHRLKYVTAHLIFIRMSALIRLHSREHLYRKHLLPKHVCLRCRKPFREQKDLEDHLRADARCEKVELVPVLGIDEATESKLRMRKKYSPDVTEEQRWKDIYIILFPKANPRSVPSPYYEPKDAVELSNKAMLKRIKKELPALMQKRVESKFDQAQAELLNGFMDIARDVVYEFCTGLPRNERSPSATPAASPRSPTPSLPGANESPVASSDDRAGEPLLDMSPYLENLFPDWSSVIDLGHNEFNFNVSDLFSMSETSDSGYASTGTVGNRSC
ncbi:hypothetical protein F4775DRAFT_237042 [Biscogniauxia sp. FL1348]|nr:hypothetical protein F4775DRAFT_237042 [Biscogniauxia sp. FL1348]